MVIDDDETVGSVINLVLSRAGYQVSLYADGRKALNDLAQVRPILVITDIVMPDMDGLEFVTKVRRQDRTVPIIAISGGGRFLVAGDLLRTAQALGVQHILAKPFEIAELTDTVARVLAARGEGNDRGS
ncbi:MAG: response regulator [Opitutales bacterium]